VSSLHILYSCACATVVASRHMRPVWTYTRCEETFTVWSAGAHVISRVVVLLHVQARLIFLS
jgi:hypothetical protein